MVCCCVLGKQRWSGKKALHFFVFLKRVFEFEFLIKFSIFVSSQLMLILDEYYKEIVKTKF